MGKKEQIDYVMDYIHDNNLEEGIFYRLCYWYVYSLENCQKEIKELKRNA